MTWNIISGIISNFIFAALTIGAAYGLSVLFGRKPLLNFFGLAERREMVIYLSHLRIQPFGAIGADGAKRSFAGSAVVHSETMGAEAIASLFRYSLPGRSIQPSWLSNILLSDVAVSVIPAPLPPVQIAFNCTTISIGSPGYSTVSMAVQNDLASPVGFNPQNTEIMMPGLPPVTNPQQAFIVRLRRGSHFVFYVGGLSEGGTKAALTYLARSWRVLHRRYRQSPSFYVLIEFVGQDSTNSHVIAERQLTSP